MDLPYLILDAIPGISTRPLFCTGRTEFRRLHNDPFPVASDLLPIGCGLDSLGIGFPVLKGKTVVVVGGGNTAMDSVRTSKRLGAERSIIVYRRSEVEMPARLEEVKHAKEEGVEFMTLHNPIEYIAGENGRVAKVRLQKMELGEPDEKGRRKPVEIPGAIEELDVDIVVVAIGVSPNPLIPSCLPDLKQGRKGTIEVNEETNQASMEEIFAGGDIVRGGATVILAMGDGRRAAAGMDKYLKAKYM